MDETTAGAPQRVTGELPAQASAPAGPTGPDAGQPDLPSPYGAGSRPAPEAAHPGPARRRVRIPHLQTMKSEGRRWAMLTAYDMYSAQIFDEAGIPVLLVGDSAGNNVYGYETTVPVTLDEMVPLVRAVSTAARFALVVADLPFGSYGGSVAQGFDSAVRMMKEGLAHAVKLEGGAPMVPLVETLTGAGIPVMAHLGFTPQSEHQLGGYRVQGRGDGADELIRAALALESAGAFAVVLEMVPTPVAERVTRELTIPTIGIGAGAGTDAQVLVWSDFAGLRAGRVPRFVKQYADLRGTLLAAARAYAADVESGAFPDADHSFEA
ncbi:MAG: 3-methyl-2-oxobutanoate hydroxymethyltransferase [Humibacillus sp.]|nr:3-methyl-2-oxobutanoate hydroxymethyltransferase [Humibacillus sp.]MDN5775327.1 3-methyl-2-oxobutanoate hydroxymethyltransferase [Humibacillus sp.]